MSLKNGNVYEYFCHWIVPPHPKIALCICAENQWFFWFNSDSRNHGIGQMMVKAGEHANITKDCYLDLSGVKTISPSELAGITDYGPLSSVFKVRIKIGLGSPIGLLPEIFRVAALNNL